jgi:hypothetical protein
VECAIEMVRSRWSHDEADGEWHFSWVLDGWGVQDVLFVTGAIASERGTSLRCYDPVAGVGRVVWFMPRRGEFVSLQATERPGAIVHDGKSLRDESRQRWTISDVTATSFLWRGESSSDEDSTWRLDQETARNPQVSGAGACRHGVW